MLQLVSSATDRGSAFVPAERVLARADSRKDGVDRAGADRVEISSAGRRFMDEQAVAASDRLERIRALIDRGEYLTPARIEGALDALIDDIKS